MTVTAINFPEPPEDNDRGSGLHLSSSFGDNTSSSGNDASYTLTTGTDDVRFIGGGECGTSAGSTHSIYYPGYYWDRYWTWPPRDPYKNARCETCSGFCPEIKACPRVKSIDYFKDGTIKKIEFHKVDDL